MEQIERKIEKSNKRKNNLIGKNQNLKKDIKLYRFKILNSIGKFCIPFVLVISAMCAGKLMDDQYIATKTKDELIISPTPISEDIIPEVVASIFGLYSLTIFEGINYDDTWTIKKIFTDKEWVKNGNDLFKSMKQISFQKSLIRNNKAKIDKEATKIEKNEEKIKKLTFQKGN